jgi:glutaminyl-tRNA synthetase
VPLTRELLIEREDFSAEPPKGFKRLTPGGTVRLRGAGIVRCDEVVAGVDGEPAELRCTLLGEDAKAAGVIHWVSATRGVPAEFRLFDRLFTVPNPDGEVAPAFDPEQPGHEDESKPVDADFMRFVNPQSLVVTRGVVEPSVLKDPAGARYQFERVGYFWQDPVDSRLEALVFNRIITLRDTWGRKEEATPDARPQAKAPRAAEKKTEAPAPARAALSAEQEPVFARLRAAGLSDNDAHLLAREPALAAYLEAAPEPQRAGLAPWVVNDLAVAIREGTNRVDPGALGELVALVQEGGISARTAKDVLAEAQGSGEAPARIVERKGLRLVSDEGQLRQAIQAVLDANPQKVAEYRGGKKGLTGFFTGQIMRATGGQADPKAVARLLGEMLG